MTGMRIETPTMADPRLTLRNICAGFGVDRQDVHVTEEA
jgi:hypothetical protein